MKLVWRNFINNYGLMYSLPVRSDLINFVDICSYPDNYEIIFFNDSDAYDLIFLHEKFIKSKKYNYNAKFIIYKSPDIGVDWIKKEIEKSINKLESLKAFI